MKINVNLMNELAKVPTYGSDGAAGCDLYACISESISVLPGETVKIPTGISLEIPDGYVGLVFPRSGLSTKKGLAPANKVGVIDADYRGEIIVVIYNQSKVEQIIEPNERIAQLAIVPYIKAEFNEVDELSETTRGTGGFGSTGTK